MEGQRRDEAGSQFLSIQAQDFIEDNGWWNIAVNCLLFLSIQAQDFIEDRHE